MVDWRVSVPGGIGVRGWCERGVSGVGKTRHLPGGERNKHRRTSMGQIVNFLVLRGVVSSAIGPLFVGLSTMKDVLKSQGVETTGIRGKKTLG